MCVEDSLGAASDCIHFICDVLDIIGGGEGICGSDSSVTGGPIKVRQRLDSLRLSIGHRASGFAQLLEIASISHEVNYEHLTESPSRIHLSYLNT